MTETTDKIDGIVCAKYTLSLMIYCIFTRGDLYAAGCAEQPNV